MYRYTVKENDFVVTCDGTLGEIFQLKNLTEKGIISSSLLRITLNPELIDYDFFYYFFKQKMKKPLITSANNSVLKHLPGLCFIRDFEIDIPDLSTQKKIADVFSCIDDKIALNNKTNNELESMAKTVYDYWFTQFDFPDANGKPYKASGGKMEYNQVLKREIPAGWEVGKLGDIAIFSSKTTTTNKIENYITTDNILPNKQGVIEAEYIPTYGSVLVYERNDILIANIRPYFKKNWLANKSGMCSNDVLCIKSRQKILVFFYTDFYGGMIFLTM